MPLCVFAHEGFFTSFFLNPIQRSLAIINLVLRFNYLCVCSKEINIFFVLLPVNVNTQHFSRYIVFTWLHLSCFNMLLKRDVLYTQRCFFLSTIEVYRR